MMDEPDVSSLLTVAEAIRIIDAAPVSPRIVQSPLLAADGMVLAEAIIADRDYPPFDKSQMDGFAVRSADVKSTPAQLRIIGEIPAGASPSQTVGDGESMAIMTGAPMPQGADGVVPVEDVERNGPTVRILRSTTPGRYIATQGSDVRAGAIVLPAGVRLGPAQLAVAASVGAHAVNVFARPRVGVLSTGDELIDIDSTPGPAQIRNSNGIMLIALLKRMGCDVTDLGIVRDRPELVHHALSHGLQHDILFVTGGMSMGDFDYVPRTLIDLGVELKITKLKIKPGKPFVFGIKEKSPASSFVFGLPGNPVSAFVCTVRLASRLIDRLSGSTIRERWTDAKLANRLEINGPREFYQPVALQDGIATPLSWKGSADVYTLAKANALLCRSENAPAVEPGATVRVLEM